MKQLNVSAKSGTTSSELAGDVLTAHFVRMDGADHLAEVHGDGHTSLRKVSAKRGGEYELGDSLVAHFRPAVGTGRASEDSFGRWDGSDDIADATEQGHVVMTKLPVKKPGDAAAPVEEHATAERAVYVHGAGSAIWSGRR